MSGQAVIRCGLLLAGFVLGVTGVAQAKIPRSQPAVGAVSGGAAINDLSEIFGRMPGQAIPGGPEITKTITLNFGPLHFQEVLSATPKACRS
jgi:hypothetical protein